MKPFTEVLRYDYVLPTSAVVLDIGAHHGEWASLFAADHACRIFSYEPTPEFFHIARGRLFPFENVTVKNYGLGAKTELRTFRIKGGMTGPWADNGPTEIVELVAIDEELKRLGVEWVDLAKINIEGSEYDLMEAILNEGLAPRFRNLQIQYHGIPDLNPQERWKKIRERLAETHTLEYGDPSMSFVDNSFEGWSRK
jgi:FkbM family methyltransferase